MYKEFHSTKSAQYVYPFFDQVLNKGSALVKFINLLTIVGYHSLASGNFIRTSLVGQQNAIISKYTLFSKNGI